MWDNRLEFVANHITPYGGFTRVMDLGAGEQRLMDYLPHTDVQYIPVDIVNRETPARTVVCDLNKTPETIENFGRVHYAVCVGVLEYIFDVHRLFRSIGAISDNVILTYNVTHDYTEAIPRRKWGWVSDLNLREIHNMLSDLRYQVDYEGFPWVDRPSEIFILASRAGVWFRSGLIKMSIIGWRYDPPRFEGDCIQRTDKK